MSNPPFQPLTLSVEEWQRIWTTQVESRDEGVNRIVKLRAECEAQAQAADSLRLQLRVITEQRDSLVVEQVSLRQRLEMLEPLLEAWRKKAEQAEAALEEMRRMIDGYAYWLETQLPGVENMPLAELQRRRSPTGESK